MYPESAPEDWIDILVLTGVPFIVSPLHDLDIDTNGSYKKPHYHVIIIFDNPTTYNHVNKHCCSPLRATIPKVILNLKGCYNYLTHEDIPSKAQYSPNDIMHYNGSLSYIKDDEYVNDVYSAIESIIKEKKPSNMLTLIELCTSITDAVGLIRSKPYYFAQLLR